jgi:hypothetical protein
LKFLLVVSIRTQNLCIELLLLCTRHRDHHQKERQIPAYSHAGGCHEYQRWKVALRKTFWKEGMKKSGRYVGLARLLRGGETVFAKEQK